MASIVISKRNDPIRLEVASYKNYNNLLYHHENESLKMNLFVSDFLRLAKSLGDGSNN